jgi:hypothetical protein
MAVRVLIRKNKSNSSLATYGLGRLQFLMCLALLFLFSPQPIFAQITGKQVFHITGQEAFEGELLSVRGSAVEIRNLQDGIITKVPISSLSREDKRFLLAWVRGKEVFSQESVPLPDGWGTLRIHFPKGYDLAFSSEIDAITRVGGRLHEGILPIGLWVNVNIYRSDSINSQFRSTYLQFNGHSDWYLSFRAGKLYRGFEPDGPSEVVAAVIPLNEETEFLRSLRTDTLADRVSFRVGDEKGLEALELFKHPVAWLSIDEGLLLDRDGQVNASVANMTVKLAPQSLSMEGGDEVLNFLSRLPSLEHLILKEPKSSPWTIQGVQSLKKLPRLQALTYRSRDYRNTSFMDGFDKLRILSVTPVSPFNSKIRVPELKALEALSIPHVFALEPSSLVGFPRIKYLDAKGVGPSYRPPQDLLHIYWGQEGGDYNTAVENGFYPNLRSLTSVEHVDYGKLPNLSRLAIEGITPDMARLAKAPSLRHLQIYEVQQVELEQLSHLPDMQDLESITFFRGTIEDLSPLAKLAKLKQIHLDRLREAPHRIDFTLLPQLESFTAYNVYQMESLFGIADHPSLTFLRLTGCMEIRSLGNPAPNHRLDSISIKDAPRLENLEALKQMTGLKAVYIAGCTGITGSLYIEDSNDLEYCRIYDSGSLPNRPTQ